jgi:hypothetical protein
MRNAAILAAIVLALPALAQEGQRQPDYSRESLLQFVEEIPESPKRERNVHFHFGGVEFHALGMDWRLMYLPLMVPLSGSAPRANRGLPDPFELTNTAFAGPPRTWEAQRRVKAEMRRIEKTERARIRVRSN